MSKKDWVLHTSEDKARRETSSESASTRPEAGADVSATAQLCTTEVDLGGLMTVLGKHLYSTPVVAIRELVQNAHDSIIRRRIEDGCYGDLCEAESGFESRITVSGDPVKGIIRVTDNGAGLTDEEIHSYLATVGVGYTRTLRQQNDETGLIGMFGLGFLSAFVLATEVTVTTTSCQTPERGWRYQSSTGENYTLAVVPPRPVGTEVALALREEYSHLASPEVLRQILGRYCILLREYVYIGDAQKPLNPERPPWHDPEGNTVEHPVWLQRKRLEFAKRFEEYFDPVCTMPIVAPSPLSADDSDATGLLWVQDGATYGTSDNRHLLVFGRGMLLDDDARDLLPAWAGFISGVVESNRLTPTASREDLQKDDQYYATRQNISEALITGLAKAAKTQPEAWRRVLFRHNEALLGAALCDERLFDLLADDVRIPTSQGDLPARALKTPHGVINVMLGAQGGFEDMLFRVLRTPVARGDRYAVVPFLRKWAAANNASLVELGTEKGNRRLFTPEHLPADEQAWLTKVLADLELVVPAHFQPRELPLVVVPDREAELKRRLEQNEADKRISTAALRLARNYTAGIDGSVTSRLYVNLDNPAIISLLERFRKNEAWETQATLLRALKIIMSANDENMVSLDVNAALGDFCGVLAKLEA